MDLYDVLSEGSHATLTSEQTANLSQAGSFSRDEPCRRVGARAWRTLDELFPLLKYEAGASSAAPDESAPLSRSMIPLLASALIVLLLGSIAFFAWDRARPLERDGSFVTHRQTSITAPAPYRASVADRNQFNKGRSAAERSQREETARDVAPRAVQMRAEAEVRAR